MPFHSTLAIESGPRILAFPVKPDSADPQPELGGALTFASPEWLILQATHCLELVVRIAGNMDTERRTNLAGHLISLEQQVLIPEQLSQERHRAFLSDLSAKQARKRRRRQKRVRQDIELSA